MSRNKNCSEIFILYRHKNILTMGSISKQIAMQFTAVYFGGNWTSVNMKDTLADVTWEDAIKQLDGFNSIAALVFHTNYYVSHVLEVLKGGMLNASDKYSFDLPILDSEASWHQLIGKSFFDAEVFALAIEGLEESILREIFVDAKYGNYYRNLTGIIEHTHYHLGQIVLIKKILKQRNS
jgi:hypothetical protein